MKSVKLKVSGVSKFTLKNLELELEKGEILTLLGPSGSGKTTLLKLIAGLEKPDSGEICIDENVVCSDREFTLPEKRKIGMVFQNHGLFPHLTVEKNICFGLHHLKQAEIRSRLDQMVEMTKLGDYLKRYPHQLSGGEQQRVALARAMITKPSLILFDEPFSNLDEHLRESLRKEMKEILKSNGETAIFVAHDQKDALSISDRIALLNEGQIEQIGTPKEIYKNPINKYVAQFFGKVNYIKAIAVKNGFLSELGFLYSSQKKICEQGEIIWRERKSMAI